MLIAKAITITTCGLMFSSFNVNLPAATILAYRSVR